VNRPEAFCRTILPEVSRTFALNIPLLPEPLDLVVTVAYLLCRIADTLEDEMQGPVELRRPLFSELARLCDLPAGWPIAAQKFTALAKQQLRATAPAGEVKLLIGTPLVLEAFSVLDSSTRPIVSRCLREMTAGMSKILETTQAGDRCPGLADLEETLVYCHYVAGTVGEMLTGLFARFSPQIEARLPSLRHKASRFGRALQLTNILKDIREDLERGSCWLPRKEMARHGLSTQTLLEAGRRKQAIALLDELIGVARRELDVALDYTLALPAEQPGIRLFCLWPLFMAALTLRELCGNPQVFEPQPVKISRDAVQQVMSLTRELVQRDDELRALYASWTFPLPKGATRIA
jgi:farnesyl-diphosphate farnesyltransferase